jgi:hypothetical protein
MRPLKDQDWPKREAPRLDTRLDIRNRFLVSIRGLEKNEEETASVRVGTTDLPVPAGVSPPALLHLFEP